MRTPMQAGVSKWDTWKPAINLTGRKARECGAWSSNTCDRGKDAVGRELAEGVCLPGQ